MQRKVVVLREAEDLAKELGLSREEFRHRISAMGITIRDRELLESVAPALMAVADDFVDDFYEHLQAFPRTAALLRSERLITRLKGTQRSYFEGLVMDELDWDYAKRLLRVGATHHRVGLRPKWYIAAFGQYLSYQLPLLEEICTSPEDLAETACALIRAVLFDAALALDAYGVRFEDSALQQMVAVDEGSPAVSSPDLAESEEQALRRNRLLRGTGVDVESEEVEERLAFLRFGDQDRAALSEHRSALEERVDAAIDAFHDLMRRSVIRTKEPITEEQLDRLHRQSIHYWNETLRAEFDRRYTMTRVRVGMIHEKLGVPLQWYLVALGVELTSMVGSLLKAEAVPMSAVVALVKASMFDVTFVVDSYMEARIATLVEMKGVAQCVVAGMTTGLLLLDGSFRITSANWAVIRLLGIAAENIKGMRALDAVPHLEGALREYRSREPRREIVSAITIGSCRCRLRLMPVVQEGKGDQVALLIDDLTAMIDAFEQNSLQESRFEQVVEDLKVAVWEADAESGIVEYVSKSLDRFVPEAAPRLLGRVTANEGLVHLEDQACFEEIWRKVASGEGEAVLEHRMPAEDGDPRWVRSRLMLLPESRKARRIRGDLHDITDSIGVRNELAERLAYQKNATTLARLAMDPTKGTQPVRRLLDMLTEPDFVEAAWILSCSPADGVEYVVASSEPRAEMPGGLLDERERLSSLRKPMRLQDAFETDLERTIYAIPFDADAADSVLLIATRPGEEMTPAYQEHAETLAAIVGSFIDRWILDDEALRRQRLEVLGTLASSVAHDLNNVLAIIGINAEFISRHPGSPNSPERFDDILEASERGAILTRDILSFMRAENGQEEGVCDVSETLDVISRTLTALLPRLVALEVDSGEPVAVSVDRFHLEQIVFNLVTNAAVAVGEAGLVRVSARREALREARSVPTGTLKEGAYAVLTVQDDGSGVPPEIAAKVFDPFFTTRPQAGGTGLGLSAVARVAASVGGGVELVQGDLSGACFQVWLPVSASGESGPRDGELEVVDEGSLRVLVVDDEEQLVRVLEMVLEDAGHDVTVCRSGTDAIARAAESFDVILSDYDLPGATGFDVMRAAHRANPKVRKVLISGVGLELPPDLAGLQIQLLLKPVQIDDLLASIARKPVDRSASRGEPSLMG